MDLGYDKVIILIQVISPIIVFIGMSNILGTQYLLPTKRQKEFTISVTCGAVVNFILNLILIRRIDSIGASIATVVAEFLVAAVQLYCVRDLIKLTSIIKTVKNYVFATVIMTVVVFGINSLLNLSGIVSVIVQVVIGASVYGICLLLLHDEFVYYMKERVVNVLKRT